MEEFKSYDQISVMDDKHEAMAALTHRVPDLKLMHEIIGRIEVSPAAPDAIRGQFNVARNMALYTYFFYALAPEVHMKTYSVMEMALRAYYDGDSKTALKNLVMKAVESGVITDAGFRHVPDDPESPYSKNFVDIYPKLRNTMAHGSDLLMPDCIDFLEKCADVVNQLFPLEL